MKKLFLIFSVVFCSLIVSANDIAPIPDTSVITFSKVYNDVKEGIAGLATALKAPAEHVYEILVRQQYVKATVGLFILVILMVSIWVTLRYANYIDDWDSGTASSGKPRYSLAVVIVGSMCSFLFLVVFFIGDYHNDIFQGFLNPEYGAIKDIINFIK